MPSQPESVFEADRRAFVDAEQVARVLAEGAAAQVAVEPVRQGETAVHRKRQRGREIDSAKSGSSGRTTASSSVTVWATAVPEMMKAAATKAQRATS
jgi:hypothetical protein